MRTMTCLVLVCIRQEDACSFQFTENALESESPAFVCNFSWGKLETLLSSWPVKTEHLLWKAQLHRWMFMTPEADSFCSCSSCCWWEPSACHSPPSSSGVPLPDADVAAGCLYSTGWWVAFPSGWMPPGCPLDERVEPSQSPPMSMGTTCLSPRLPFLNLKLWS